jgi:hypothetical protein
MDVISHALWANALFRKKKWAELGIFFGIFPDVGFLPIILHVLFATPLPYEEALSSVPHYLFIPYFLLHSFVALGIVALILFIWAKEYLPALLGWFLHIIIDIPVHDGFFATRFIYPISNYGISGIPWTNVWIFVGNYLALGGIYLYLLIEQVGSEKKRKAIMSSGFRIYDIMKELKENKKGD